MDRKALVGFIAEIEASRDRAKGETRHQSEIFKAAREKGFEPKAMRKVLQRRAMSTVDRESIDEAVDLYEHALGTLAEARDAVEGGMSAREAAEKFDVPRAALGAIARGSRNAISEPPHDPTTGEITPTHEMGRSAAEHATESSTGETGEASQDGESRPATSDFGQTAATAPLGNPEREARSPTKPLEPSQIAQRESVRKWEENHPAETGSATVVATGNDALSPDIPTHAAGGLERHEGIEPVVLGVAHRCSATELVSRPDSCSTKSAATAEGAFSSHEAAPSPKPILAPPPQEEPPTPDKHDGSVRVIGSRRSDEEPSTCANNAHMVEPTPPLGAVAEPSSAQRIAIQDDDLEIPHFLRRVVAPRESAPPRGGSIPAEGTQ